MSLSAHSFYTGVQDRCPAEDDGTADEPRAPCTVDCDRALLYIPSLIRLKCCFLPVSVTLSVYPSHSANNIVEVSSLSVNPIIVVFAFFWRYTIPKGPSQRVR